MDKYSVKLMSRTLRDLDGIYDYIAHTLLELTPKFGSQTKDICFTQQVVLDNRCLYK